MRKVPIGALPQIRQVAAGLLQFVRKCARHLINLRRRGIHAKEDAVGRIQGVRPNQVYSPPLAKKRKRRLLIASRGAFFSASVILTAVAIRSQPNNSLTG